MPLGKRHAAQTPCTCDQKAALSGIDPPSSLIGFYAHMVLCLLRIHGMCHVRGRIITYLYLPRLFLCRGQPPSYLRLYQIQL